MSTSPLTPAPKTTSDSLAAAVELFWRRGFVATSLSDLLACMKVSRKRIYSTYGSKEALFRAVLKAYVTDHARPRMACLRSGPLGLGAVESYLRSWEFGPDFKGCLLWNSAAESENLTPEALQIVRSHFDELGAALVENLQAAKQQRELPQHAAVVPLSQMVLHSAMGLSVMGKLVARPDASNRIVSSLMEGLRCDKAPPHSVAAV